jgi:DNA-binding NtrC family response regulator
VSIPGYRTARRIWQRAYITELLTQTGGNLAKAQHIAHIERSTLQRLIRSLAPTLALIRQKAALQKLAGLRQ